MFKQSDIADAVFTIRTMVTAAPELQGRDTLPCKPEGGRRTFIS